MDKTLRKIAKGIEHMCACGCPCEEGCAVYSDEECISRIVDWLKEMIERGEPNVFD